jgi:hypothetical protein
MNRLLTLAVVVLVTLPVALAQRANATAPGGKFVASATKPVPVTAPMPVAADENDYGLAPGQGIPHVEVKLAVRGAARPVAPNSVFSRTGGVIATDRTGPAGGVTFPNVPPGAYVLLFRIVELPVPAVKFPALKRATMSSLRWRTFPDVGYEYGVGAPNLVFGDAERQRSRDDMNNQVVTIAQEFEIRGSEPTAIHAAIGQSASAR